uniref:Putative secreted protein n=1 Tax=Anopheles triannulatus TaxID=58253 RepID=A0A2M4B3M0_9DIPT
MLAMFFFFSLAAAVQIKARGRNWETHKHTGRLSSHFCRSGAAVPPLGRASWWPAGSHRKGIGYFAAR